jgi:hypothetical protein
MHQLTIESAIPQSEPAKTTIEAAVSDALAPCDGQWRAAIVAAPAGPGWWTITVSRDRFRWSLLVRSTETHENICASLSAGLPRPTPRRAASMPVHEPVAEGERRRQPRFDVVLPVTLIREGPTAGEVFRETTATDDLGPGGMKVPCSLRLARGQRVMVEVVDLFAVSATVQGISIGRDQIARLSLAFQNPEAADHVWLILQRAGLS